MVSGGAEEERGEYASVSWQEDILCEGVVAELDVVRGREWKKARRGALGET